MNKHGIGWASTEAGKQIRDYVTEAQGRLDSRAHLSIQDTIDFFEGVSHSIMGEAMDSYCKYHNTEKPDLTLVERYDIAAGMIQELLWEEFGRRGMSKIISRELDKKLHNQIKAKEKDNADSKRSH